MKASEGKLVSSESNLWFVLKSGIIFDREEFLLVGDAMDHLCFNYEVSGSVKEVFLGSEGYMLYYKNGDIKKEMTLSHGEVRFFKEYIITCESQNRPWDWEPITDM